MKRLAENRVRADILVIGGGIAGLFAAIKAKERAPQAEVVLVDKAFPGRSGCSVFAAGVFPHWMPQDPNTDEYIREIVVDNAEYLIDQDYAELAVKESYDRFRDLQKFGVEFAHNSSGKLLRVPTLASKFGFCTPFAGGPHLMWKVKAQAEALGVKMLDRIMVTNLLIAGGRCAGAVGFHLRTGQGYIFTAKGTVLAAGTYMSNRAPMGASGGSGDGTAMALRAGCEMRNMDQLKTNYGPKNLGVPGLHVIFGQGGILVNARGERFMERYHPELKEEARRYDTARAIINEWREGRGPCCLDCTHLSAGAIDTIRKALPLVMKSLKAQGLDIARDKIEFIPYGVSLLHHGGARLNSASGDVGIAGLWVVGAAGDYCGGADSTAVTTLAGSSVQGARAGKEVARYIHETSWPKVPSELVQRAEEDIFSPLKSKGRKGIEPDSMIYQILQIVFRNINVLRSEANLKAARKGIEALKGKLTQVKARDPHELQKYHNARNMLQVAEVVAGACLLRTESRRAHYRIDYPKRDDENWLKWVIARLENGKVTFRTEAIPLENWKYRP